MAIVNTYQTLYPGYGQPTVYGVQNAVSLTGTVQQTNSFTTSNTTGLAQGMTKGLVRVKIYNAGGTTPAVSFIVNVTDQTNTYVIATIPSVTLTSGAANSGLDIYIDTGVDISFNQVNVLTTLTGTSPTASMDLELVAGP